MRLARRFTAVNAVFFSLIVIVISHSSKNCYCSEDSFSESVRLYFYMQFIYPVDLVMRAVLLYLDSVEISEKPKVERRAVSYCWWRFSVSLLFEYNIPLCVKMRTQLFYRLF